MNAVIINVTFIDASAARVAMLRAAPEMSVSVDSLEFGEVLAHA
jgi:hypothetical protein